MDCLLDEKMVLSDGRNLWQVGNTEHLRISSNQPNLIGDCLGNPTTDPGIGLIKDNAGDPLISRKDSFKGQHHPRQFPTRSNFS